MRATSQLLFLAAAVTGCAAPMALKPGDTELSMEGDGLVVLSTHISNAYKEYEVRAISVAVLRIPGEEERARIAEARAAASPNDPVADDGTGVRIFEVGDPIGSGGTPGNSWEQRLVVLRLPPGHWETSHVNLAAGSFLASGIGWAKLRASFDVAPGTVTYIGRIVGNRRERTQANEPMAGPPIPLIDQAVTGFSGGTVDVSVRDEGDADLSSARSIYPALQKVEIRKAIMALAPPEK